MGKPRSWEHGPWSQMGRALGFWAPPFYSLVLWRLTHCLTYLSLSVLNFKIIMVSTERNRNPYKDLPQYFSYTWTVAVSYFYFYYKYWTPWLTHSRHAVSISCPFCFSSTFSNLAHIFWILFIDYIFSNSRNILMQKILKRHTASLKPLCFLLLFLKVLLLAKLSESFQPK